MGIGSEVICMIGMSRNMLWTCSSLTTSWLHKSPRHSFYEAMLGIVQVHNSWKLFTAGPHVPSLASCCFANYTCCKVLEFPAVARFRSHISILPSSVSSSLAPENIRETPTEWQVYPRGALIEPARKFQCVSIPDSATKAKAFAWAAWHFATDSIENGILGARTWCVASLHHEEVTFFQCSLFAIGPVNIPTLSHPQLFFGFHCWTRRPSRHSMTITPARTAHRKVSLAPLSSRTKQSQPNWGASMNAAFKGGSPVFHLVSRLLEYLFTTWATIRPRSPVFESGVDS